MSIQWPLRGDFQEFSFLFSESSQSIGKHAINKFLAIYDGQYSNR